MEKYCILAGGCFWCIAAPFYDLKGVENVISGYSGGNVINPKYEEVKSQTTGHYEVIKIIYNDNLISYQEILDLYFSNIDLFDDGGQFIDRGQSYQTAIFYHNELMKETASKMLNKLNIIFENKVKVKLLQEEDFYIAEEYHQDYAIKNPEKFNEELILSGRKIKK